jgi:hypothetical protein
LIDYSGSPESLLAESLALSRFHSYPDGLLINLSTIQEQKEAPSPSFQTIYSRVGTDVNFSRGLKQNPVEYSRGKSTHVSWQQKACQRLLASYGLRTSLPFVSFAVCREYPPASRSRGVRSDAGDPTSHDGCWGPLLHGKKYPRRRDLLALLMMLSSGC